MNIKKVNRNDPCPCGSGKKYKQCCQALLNAQQSDPNAHLRAGVPDLFKQAFKYQASNHLEKAESIYQQILDIHPKHVDSLYNLGLLASHTARPEMAIDLLNKVIRLEPSAPHYCGLAQALLVSNKREEDAMVYFKKAIALNPGDATVYSNIGTLLWTLDRYNEAIPYLQKSITLDRTQTASIGHLASCFLKLGKYQEAASYLRQAITMSPHTDLNYHNLLYCLSYDSSAFPITYLQEARRLEALFTSRATPYQQWNTLSPQENIPLRVGLVSGDFRNHPVGYFLESIIYSLNKANVTFFAYSTQLNEDDLTARIKPHFAKWTNINTLNDKQAAEKIHSDQIDILVDLAGHTANNRLSLFAWRGAPIQISWLGYFASTGMTFIDYFLADPISVSNESHFTEKVWYLPDTRLCFTPPASNIEQHIDSLPALKNGYITFGCFQNLSKINNKMLNVWAEILKKCYKSKLLVKSHQFKDHYTKRAFINQLEICGISIDDVILELGSPRTTYLNAYNSVDIILDTSPFPGGTTTCEALWMGVPTLTLTGDTLLEKQGASLLSCVGLSDWIAEDENDYIQKAVAFANNKPVLHELKQNLRATIKASPLVDAKRFAENLEKALFGMWHDKIG